MNWTLVKNNSWGERDKELFGDKPGFLICKGSRLIPIASIHPTIESDVAETTRIAKLMNAAPELLEALRYANDALMNSYPDYKYSEQAERIENAINKATK